MKKIPLTKGHFALVDDEDFEELSKYKWNLRTVKNSDRMYAYRAFFRNPNGKKSPVAMHRQILGETRRHIDVDHIDRNGINNQRSNLRISTRSQNNANATLPRDNKSGYKGVSFDKRRNLWKAAIASNCLGRFEEKEEAARAYNKAAFEMWGEFARLNDVFPQFPTVEKSKTSRNNTSGYIGVSRTKNTSKWCAEITVKYKKICIGSFDCPEEAARAYDEAAKRFRGDSAKTNF